VQSGSTIAYPPSTSDFQHEVELVLAIGRPCKAIDAHSAQKYIFGAAVGVDLTRRDLQLKARDAGRPWESGKSFDQSAPISSIHRLTGTGLPREGRIALRINGVTKQDGNLKEMIWQSDEIVGQLSHLFALEAGDLIFTGTPAGVGTIERGDRLVGEIAGIDTVSIEIAP
jgi:fumarylpyruvate hydrolase